MPIPDFNSHGVLPPYNGDLKQFGATSPYAATTLELCRSFGTSRERRSILRGFLAMRALMHQLDIVKGFQWIDGPFLEKDGKRNGRNPDCIQVVTFFHASRLYDDPAYTDQFKPLKSAKETRGLFSVDHGLVSLDWSPLEIIDSTRHWTAILSHQADTGIWKGLLKIRLCTLEEDAAALQHLNEQEAP